MEYVISSRLITAIILIFCLMTSQNLKAQEKKVYAENVGDIVFNKNIDKSNFLLTGERIRQYYNFFPGVAIKGEKAALKAYFEEKYLSYECEDTGYLIIRFIVNFEGETDRFRTLQMDSNYHETNFTTETISQILSITKSITEWKVAEVNGRKFDYYQYLTFILKNGQIKEILP